MTITRSGITALSVTVLIVLKVSIVLIVLIFQETNTKNGEAIRNFIVRKG